MYGELCVFKPLGLVEKYMKFSRRVLGSIPMMTAGVMGSNPMCALCVLASSDSPTKIAIHAADCTW